MTAEIARVYEPDAGSCARVRRDVATFLVTVALPDDVVDAAVTVANELAGNAVDHAHTPFRLVLTLTEHHLRIDAADGSTAPPHLHPVDPRALWGRGLQMIDYLATSWTYEIHPAGKIITADIAIHSPTGGLTAGGRS